MIIGKVVTKMHKVEGVLEGRARYVLGSQSGIASLWWGGQLLNIPICFSRWLLRIT